MYKKVTQLVTVIALISFRVQQSRAQETIPEENELTTSYLTLSYSDSIKKTDAAGEIFQNKIEEIEAIAQRNDFKKFKIIAKSIDISKTEEAYKLYIAFSVNFIYSPEMVTMLFKETEGWELSISVEDSW